MLKVRQIVFKIAKIKKEYSGLTIKSLSQNPAIVRTIDVKRHRIILSKMFFTLECFMIFYVSIYCATGSNIAILSNCDIWHDNTSCSNVCVIFNFARSYYRA